MNSLFGIAMLLASLLLAGAGAVTLIVARLRGVRLRHLAPGLGAGMAAWMLLYAGALMGTSIASTPRVLGPGESKSLCGFYVGCRARVAVAGVDTALELGAPGARVRAGGRFHVVRLRIELHATETMRLAVTARDAYGNVYRRATEAEAAHALASAIPRLGRDAGRADAFEVFVVFDMPYDVEGLVLDVREGYLPDRFIERVLIGDEDSFLHQRTFLALTS